MKKTIIIGISILFVGIWGCKKKKKEQPKKEATHKHQVVQKHKVAKQSKKVVKRPARVKPPSKPITKAPLRPKIKRPQPIKVPPIRPTAQKKKPVPRLVPDPRLLLTVADATELGLKNYERTFLPGRYPSSQYDSIYFKLKKGFGIALQEWGFKHIGDMRKKFDELLADLPNAQGIQQIGGGRTLFAYWGDLIYVAFEHPRKRLIVNLICSKKICTSDRLYELGRRIYQRLNLMGR